MRRFIRWARLQKATWTIRFRAFCERIQTRYERATCPHSFRPARVNGQPGRFCKICECAASLSREDFYAEFGERGLAMLVATNEVWQPEPPQIHIESVN